MNNVFKTQAIETDHHDDVHHQTLLVFISEADSQIHLHSDAISYDVCSTRSVLKKEFEDVHAAKFK